MSCTREDLVLRPFSEFDTIEGSGVPFHVFGVCLSKRRMDRKGVELDFVVCVRL